MEDKKMSPQLRYRKNHAKRYCFDFNTGTDMDVISKLDNVPNRAGYIKSLIRADIAKNSTSQPEQ